MVQELAVMEAGKVKVKVIQERKVSHEVQIFATPRDRSGHFTHTVQHTYTYMYMNLYILMQ